MNKNIGITESFWSALPEDKRLAWKYFSRAIALSGSFFITKTGNAYIDWILLTITAIFLLIVVETQRSYSRLSPQLRKQSIRVAIFLGSWSIAVFGMAIFVQASLASMVVVFTSEITPVLNHGTSLFIKIVFTSAFLLAVPLALIRTFRQLGFEELIYHLPRKGLKQLLILKQPKATTFGLFAHMELSVLIVCLVYASSVANILKTILSLFHVS